MYAHAETTTIAGTSFYLHRSSSADGPATSLNASAQTSGRKLMGRWVYPLTGIASIPASTWTVTYRAMKSPSSKDVVAHGDIDISIRRSDGTVRSTIATDVANSPSLATTNNWETLTATYAWTAYTVVEQTDYLEVAYYIHVTVPQTSKKVFLRIDDNTLALADQTKIENVTFTYANQAPVASFTYSPPDPVILETVTFNASGSYDPDGSIVSYQWDFGDGNITTVTNPIITHVYASTNSTVIYTVTLNVTDNEGLTDSITEDVPVTNPSILRISLPDGTYSGVNPDPWLNEGWILNINSSSGTFTLRINDTSTSITSYDTHLIIALNNASYNNLVSLTVNSTSIPKSAFQYGTPKPYNIWNWPSGDVFPTWFNDTYIIGTINNKTYEDLSISMTLSNGTGARMHFDAYGSKDPVPPSPDVTGKITHNPISGDSTVLFFPPEVVEYYLEVSSPYGTTGGQGWYTNGSLAYATLDTSTVDHGNGTRRVFLQWSGDASGTNYAQSDPILMDGNKTAVAVWATQYYLNVTSPYGVTAGSDWYNASSTAYASLDTGSVDHGNGTRRLFVSWSGDASGTNYANSDPIIMDAPKTAIAQWKTQYYLTVISPYGTPSGEGWYDNSTTITVSLDTGLVDHGNDTRRIFINWSGDGSGTNYSQSDPIHVDSPKTIIAVWKTQYLITFDQTGLDASAIGTIVRVDTEPKVYGDLPYSLWVDNGTTVTYSYTALVPSSVSSKRFQLINVTGPPSPIIVTSPVPVTGNYKKQYKVIFNQTGVGNDFTGTVVTVDAVGYDVSQLPKDFWWDESSDHSFSFASPLVVNATKQYLWQSTTGLSSLQSGILTVTTYGDVTGNYAVGIKYQVTFDQTGVGLDFTGTVVTIDGTDYDVSALPVSFLWDSGSQHNFSYQSPLVVTPTAKQYVWNSTSGLSSLQSDSITVSTSGSITGNYKTQYYLTLTTSPPSVTTPSGEGWYYAGTNASISTTPLVDIVPGASRYSFSNWTTGDMSEIANASSPSTTVLMDKAKTVTANYVTQYYLTVISPYDAPGGAGWYDNSTDAYATLATDTVDHGNGTRRVFTHWSGDASGTNYTSSDPIHMDGPKTAVAQWKTQFLLTVKTDPTGLTPAPTPTSDWYDNSTNVVLTAPSVSYLGSDKYDFTYWDVDGSKIVGNPTIVHMNRPHTATAHYVTPKPRPVGGFWEPANVTSPTIDYTLMIMALLTIAAGLTGTLIPMKKRSKEK